MYFWTFYDNTCLPLSEVAETRRFQVTFSCGTVLVGVRRRVMWNIIQRSLGLEEQVLMESQCRCSDHPMDNGALG